MAQPGPGASGRARHRRLSATWIFFLVISASSPLTSIIGTAPLGILQGNGAGLPAAYVVVTLLLLCFAVGYAAISRRVINTGAFYTYIAQGVGRPPAVGAALLAVVAYACNVAGIGASGGYFLKLVMAESGVDISWIWGCLFGLALIGFLGYRSLRISAKVLGSIMVVGIALLAIFDVLVVADLGLDAFPAASFAPATIMSGSPGMAALFALTCFVGFETAAIYTEETDDPERTVPRAIYVAVIGMGVFYVLSMWILIGALGPDRAEATAQEKLGSLVFDEMAARGGDGLRSAAALLFLGATFAGMLAFHNAASRYLLVLGRDRILPAQLGRLHPRHRSPATASLLVSAATLLIVLIGALVGLDPYEQLAQVAIGLATLGIVVLQAFAGLAIVAFFRRRGQGQYWRTLILPGIATAGLFGAVIFYLLNFNVLTGGRSPFAIALPWLLVAVGIVGVFLGLRIRSQRPARYARLAENRLRPQERRLERPARWTRRYCLIGAGPAGLAMARRLVEEGVPFDWYERYHDVGGIWHLDREGSPIYDTCVSISSKFTSAFPDFPMPADYPDYPRWWQMRDYLRAYAQAFGLYEHVTLNTAVTWAKPEGLGWAVTLTNGSVRYYAGIIAAPGKSWRPVLPSWPGQERFRGQILHTSRYLSPADLAGRRVLVVGAGNSGAEIACDAARSAVSASLSIRSGRRFLPRHLGGVPTDAVLAGVLEPPEKVLVPPDAFELIESMAPDVAALGMPVPDYSVLASHPTVTSELLTFVNQGWVTVRPDIAELMPDGVRYADGTGEYVDLIIAATGYEAELPFLAPEVYSGLNQRPDLYLNLFSRRYDTLAILGLSDFAGATFPRFDDMARAVIVDLTLRELGGPEWQAWHAMKETGRPDMRGGRRFVDSPAHDLFVDDHAYQVVLRDVVDRFGYAPEHGIPVLRAPAHAR